MTYAEIGGSRSFPLAVGVVSVAVLPPNRHRKQALITNDSANGIWLSKGSGPALLNGGQYLAPNGGHMTIAPDTTGRIWRGAVQAISAFAAQNLSVSEDW